MFGRRPVFYFIVASSLAVIALTCLLVIGRLVTPQAQVSPQGDTEAASRAMRFSTPKDGSQ